MATLDLLTLEEAKLDLDVGVGDSSDNPKLTSYISAASLHIDRWAGPVVRRTVPGEVHDGSTSSLHYGYGRQVVILNQRPVASFTSVVEYDGTTATTLTEHTATVHPNEGYLSGRYLPDRSLYDGHLRRMKSGTRSCWQWGDANILATYVAGRFESTTTVSETFKQACRYVLQNMWRGTLPSVQNIDEFPVPARNFPAFATPNVVKELLGAEAGTGVARRWGIA